MRKKLRSFGVVLITLLGLFFPMTVAAATFHNVEGVIGEKAGHVPNVYTPTLLTGERDGGPQPILNLSGEDFWDFGRTVNKTDRWTYNFNGTMDLFFWVRKATDPFKLMVKLTGDGFNYQSSITAAGIGNGLSFEDIDTNNLQVTIWDKSARKHPGSKEYYGIDGVNLTPAVVPLPASALLLLGGLAGFGLFKRQQLA